MSSDKNTDKNQGKEDKLQSVNKFQKSVDIFNQNIDNATDKIIDLFNKNSNDNKGFDELNKKFTKVVKEVKSNNQNFNKDIIKDLNDAIDNVSSNIYHKYKKISVNNLHSRKKFFTNEKCKSMIIKSSFCILFYIFFFRRLSNVFYPKLFKMMYFITSINYILIC